MFSIAIKHCQLECTQLAAVAIFYVLIGITLAAWNICMLARDATSTTLKQAYVETSDLISITKSANKIIPK